MILDSDFENFKDNFIKTISIQPTEVSSVELRQKWSIRNNQYTQKQNLKSQILHVAIVSPFERIANSEDPDQTASKGAVWSVSTLFAIVWTFWMHYCMIKSR